MNKKAPQIFYINNREEEFNLIRTIQKQLNKHKYLEVINAAIKAKNKFPRNHFFYVMASIAYLQLKQPMNAMNILMEADKNIPNDFQIKFHLAKTYENLDDYSNAEDCYRSALVNADIKDNDLRSDILNDLGALLITMERKDEALECWKSALMEYPKNINAQNNLRNFANQSRRPGTPNKLFEDLHHFQKIQTEKFFADKNRSEFKNKRELEFCINKIMAAWNFYIAPNSEKLDSLSIEQKSNWFRSIEIPFDDKSIKSKSNKMNRERGKIKKSKTLKTLENSGDSERDKINNIFPFLPEDGIVMVMFGSAALLAAGMPGDRYMEILKTGVYDEGEKGLIYWAFEIAVLVMQSLIVKNEKEKFPLLEEAKDIAEEFIKIEDVDFVISTIQETMKKEFIDKPKVEKKSKK